MSLLWLAGNCGNLSEHDFGVAHMPEVLDILDDTFLNVVGDGQLLLSEGVMMHMFDVLREKIEPFNEYLNYMLEEMCVNFKYR